MRVDAEQAVAQGFLETGHHRHDDVQGHDADHNAADRDQGDQRDKRLAPARLQITQADEKFVAHQMNRREV